MRILYELPPVLRELVHSTALGEIKQPTTTIPMLSFTNTISMLFIPSTLFLIRHLSRILLMHICVLQCFKYKYRFTQGTTLPAKQKRQNKQRKPKED